MSAQELNGWRYFFETEPFGETRDNWHMAVLASILANVNRKPGTKPLTVTDFMYTDPVTAKEKREKETLAWFEKRSEPD